MSDDWIEAVISKLDAEAEAEARHWWHLPAWVEHWRAGRAGFRPKLARAHELRATMFDQRAALDHALDDWISERERVAVASPPHEITRQAVRSFVRDYIAEAKAHGGRPTQMGVLQAWKAAGHGARRREWVKESFDKESGDEKPAVGRPPGNSQKN